MAGIPGIPGKSKPSWSEVNGLLIAERIKNRDNKQTIANLKFEVRRLKAQVSDYRVIFSRTGHDVGEKAA